MTDACCGSTICPYKHINTKLMNMLISHKKPFLDDKAHPEMTRVQKRQDRKAYDAFL